MRGTIGYPLGCSRQNCTLTPALPIQGEGGSLPPYLLHAVLSHSPSPPPLGRALWGLRVAEQPGWCKTFRGNALSRVNSPCTDTGESRE